MAELTIQFGVDTDVTFGVVQSISDSETPAVAVAKGPKGQCVKRQAYSKTVSKKIEALIKVDQEKPAAGTVATVDGLTGLVMSSEITSQNEDFKKINLTVDAVDGIAGDAYVAPSVAGE